MKNTVDKSLDFQQLYELALAIGHSTHTIEDSRVFLHKLLSICPISTAQVWHKHNNNFLLFTSQPYALPQQLEQELLPQLQVHFQANTPLLVSTDKLPEWDIPALHSLVPGLHIFYALRESVVLHLHQQANSAIPTIAYWQQLLPVLKKWAVATPFLDENGETPKPKISTTEKGLQKLVLYELDFDGLIVVDRIKGHPVNCNRKILEYLNISRKELLQEIDPLDWSPEYQPNGESSEVFGRAIRKRLATENIFRYEWQYKRQDGTLLDTEVTTFLAPVPNDFLRVYILRDISESKQLLKDLKYSDSQLRRVQKLAKVGSFEYNYEKDELFFSEATQHIFGIAPSPDKLSLKKFTTGYVQPEIHQELYERVEEAKIDNSGFDLEGRFIRGDGELFYAHVYAKVLEEKNGGLILYGSVQDITIQYRYNKSLRISRANLQEAQKLAKIGSCDYDVKENKLMWSDQTFQIFGSDPSVGEPSLEEYKENLIHPADRDLFFEKIELAISNGTSFELEARQRKFNGEIIYTVNTAKALQKGDKTYKLVGTVQDITERKLGEQELLKTSEKYTQLFDNLYDAIVVTNQEGRMINANKSAQKMLGYNLEELGQLLIPDIVHPEDMDRSLQFLKKLQSEGYYSDYQGRIFRKDGQVVYVQVNSNAIYDEEGKMVGSRDIVRDITELKKAEHKREQLLEELEFVNQELRDFAYVVSHDLKAPLRAISSLSQWLYEDNKDKLEAEGIQQLELLINRSNRMHNFIEAILEYSRIGRIKGTNEWVDLNAIISEIKDILAISAPFKIDIPISLPLFFGEKVRIVQLFQNLISNAIKYNDKDQGILCITWSDQGSHLRFSVEDNGPGIAPQYHNKIFKIFQTLHARDDIESTGIGLTIVKRIVQLYEGEIEVRSTEGISTTFDFTLKKM